MILLLLAGLFVAGTVATVAFWPTVVNRVADWLRRHDLDRSALMSATVLLDRVAVGVRRRIRVRTHTLGFQNVADETLSPDQIDDPQVRALLERRSQVQYDIMEQL
jgi:hypothetical protein